jgi:hypothetical protein
MKLRSSPASSASTAERIARSSSSAKKEEARAGLLLVAWERCVLGAANGEVLGRLEDAAVRAGPTVDEVASGIGVERVDERVVVRAAK